MCRPERLEELHATDIYRVWLIHCPGITHNNRCFAARPGLRVAWATDGHRWQHEETFLAEISAYVKQNSDNAFHNVPTRSAFVSIFIRIFLWPLLSSRASTRTKLINESVDDVMINSVIWFRVPNSNVH